MQLLERTQLLLKEKTSAGVGLREIADASEGAVNLEWLKKLKAGKIKNPGVNSIQSLHDCLKKFKQTKKAN